MPITLSNINEYAYAHKYRLLLGIVIGTIKDWYNKLPIKNNEREEGSIVLYSNLIAKDIKIEFVNDIQFNIHSTDIVETYAHYNLMTENKKIKLDSNGNVDRISIDIYIPRKQFQEQLIIKKLYHELQHFFFEYRLLTKHNKRLYDEIYGKKAHVIYQRVALISSLPDLINKTHIEELRKYNVKLEGNYISGDEYYPATLIYHLFIDTEFNSFLAECYHSIYKNNIQKYEDLTTNPNISVSQKLTMFDEYYKSITDATYILPSMTCAMKNFSTAFKEKRNLTKLPLFQKWFISTTNKKITEFKENINQLIDFYRDVDKIEQDKKLSESFIRNINSNYKMLLENSSNNRIIEHTVKYFDRTKSTVRKVDLYINLNLFD